jgi:twitching motility protein PilT
MLEQALQELLDTGGSDLLISCGSPPRIRKDGLLHQLSGMPDALRPPDTERLLRSLLDNEQWAELHRRGHVDFAFTW